MFKWFKKKEYKEYKYEKCYFKMDQYGYDGMFEDIDSLITLAKLMGYEVRGRGGESSASIYVRSISKNFILSFMLSKKRIVWRIYAMVDIKSNYHVEIDSKDDGKFVIQEVIKLL